MTQTSLAPTTHAEPPGGYGGRKGTGSANEVTLNGLSRADHDEPDDECGAMESIILKGEHVHSSFSMQLA